MHIYGIELCVLVLLEILTPLRGGWGNPQAGTLGPPSLWCHSLVGSDLKGTQVPQLVCPLKNVLSSKEKKRKGRGSPRDNLGKDRWWNFGAQW